MRISIYGVVARDLDLNALKEAVEKAYSGGRGDRGIRVSNLTDDVAIKLGKLKLASEATVKRALGLGLTGGAEATHRVIREAVREIIKENRPDLVLDAPPSLGLVNVLPSDASDPNPVTQAVCFAVRHEAHGTKVAFLTYFPKSGETGKGLLTVQGGGVPAEVAWPNPAASSGPVILTVDPGAKLPRSCAPLQSSPPGVKTEVFIGALVRTAGNVTAVWDKGEIETAHGLGEGETKADYVLVRGRACGVLPGAPVCVQGEGRRWVVGLLTGQQRGDLLEVQTIASLLRDPAFREASGMLDQDRRERVDEVEKILLDEPELLPVIAKVLSSRTPKAMAEALANIAKLEKLAAELVLVLEAARTAKARFRGVDEHHPLMKMFCLLAPLVSDAEVPAGPFVKVVRQNRGHLEGRVSVSRQPLVDVAIGAARATQQPARVDAEGNELKPKNATVVRPPTSGFNLAQAEEETWRHLSNLVENGSPGALRPEGRTAKEQVKTVAAGRKQINERALERGIPTKAGLMVILDNGVVTSGRILEALAEALGRTPGLLAVEMQDPAKESQSEPDPANQPPSVARPDRPVLAELIRQLYNDVLARLGQPRPDGAARAATPSAAPTANDEGTDEPEDRPNAPSNTDQ
jgi:hypothetical protein